MNDIDKDMFNFSDKRVTFCSGGSTDLAAAIRVVRTQLLSAAGGARAGSQKVAVFMVEGRSLNDTAAVTEAILARRAGIHLLVVGVSESGTALSEWLGVASYPSNINVFAVPAYDQLPAIVNRLVTSVNNGTQVPLPHQPHPPPRACC